MRVVAGKFRGRILNFVSDSATRPTADVVKQALFTKLQFEFPMGNVLDLFAGSGSLGIEALSRGAERVFFVEKQAKNCKIIEENLKNLKITYEKNNLQTKKEAALVFGDFLDFLKNVNVKFDLILIDPPYESNFYTEALEIIYEYKLLSENGHIVLEHDEKKVIEVKNFNIISEKKYGKRRLTFLTNKGI